MLHYNNKRVLVIAFTSLVAPKKAIDDEYKLISSLHFLPLHLLCSRFMVAFLEQENLTQHGISIPPQSCLQCWRRPVTSRVIDPPRARKYHAILDYSRGRWPTVCSPLSTLIANLYSCFQKLRSCCLFWQLSDGNKNYINTSFSTQKHAWQSSRFYININELLKFVYRS